MRGKTALIGFLVIQAAILVYWIGSLAPVLSSGAPFFSPDAHIFTGRLYGVEAGNFRMGTTGLSAAPFKVFEYPLWSTLLIVGSAVVAWFAGGAFRRDKSWLSAGLAVLALGLAAGGAYYIVEQWAGDTMFPPGSVNDQMLYMATRTFLVQMLVGWVLFAIYTVLAIAGVATSGKPLGYHLVVLNWIIVAIVWLVVFLALYLPSAGGGGG